MSKPLVCRKCGKELILNQTVGYRPLDDGTRETLWGRLYGLRCKGSLEHAGAFTGYELDSKGTLRALTDEEWEQIWNPEPLPGRIPTEQRPKRGEVWTNRIGELCRITYCDPYGRFFDYERICADGSIAFGAIMQTDVMDGLSRRVPSSSSGR
jgi:hypothetical protein